MSTNAHREWARGMENVATVVGDVLMREDDLGEESREDLAWVLRVASAAAASWEESAVLLEAIITQATALSNQLSEVRAASSTSSTERDRQDHIEYLRIPVRVYNALYRADLHYVPEVRALTDGQLLTIRGIGAQSLTVIRWALEDHEWRWWDHRAAAQLGGDARGLRRWWEEMA